jgi:hypothetical protein
MFKSQAKSLVTKIFGLNNLSNEQLETLKEKYPILARIISTK